VKQGGNRSSEILAVENREIFQEKVKLSKFSTEFKTFFGNREENLKQRGKCIIASGRMDAPGFENKEYTR